MRLASEMGVLQTFFYLGLLLGLFAVATAVLLVVGASRLPAAWRAGHPVVAALAAAVLAAIALFAVVGTAATLRANLP
jgi:hypothetical protein